jgi:hypothetical protein
MRVAPLRHGREPIRATSQYGLKILDCIFRLWVD